MTAHSLKETMDRHPATIPQQAFGLDSSEILEEHMDTESRNRGIVFELEEIFRLIDAVANEQDFRPTGQRGVTSERWFQPSFFPASR